MASGLILGIESSCDETAASVVERGSRTLSSVVASQIATHARYGGVVPELASREHLRAIVPVVRAALAQAGITLADLDAIAVTSGPGLAGALLVGITYAKALAFAQGIPLIAVNHLEGHIHAVLLHEREAETQVLRLAPLAQDDSAEGRSGSAGAKARDDLDGFAARLKSCPVTKLDLSETESAAKGVLLSKRELGSVVSQVSESRPGPPADSEEPALALVVSGGHTHLYACRPAHGAWTYKLVGRTVDDAAGEAYDKVAKLLGFGYPGGPWVDALAQFGNPKAVPFAFSQIKTKLHLGGKAPRTKAAKTAPIADLDPHLLFSFSGIKTAVLRYVELHGLRDEAQARAARLFPPSGAALEVKDTEKAQDELPEEHPSGAKAHADFEAVSARLKSCPVTEPGSAGPASGTRDTIAPQSATPPRTKEEALALCSQQVLDLLASFQHAVVGDLMKKTFAAAESLGARRILVTGGVAANRELRARFSAEAARLGIRVAFPTLALSTDNAAMIAAAAWPRFQAGDFAALDLSGNPSLTLGR
jgi:tRNA A37 threonylcarbamoyltransferase TsaD